MSDLLVRNLRPETIAHFKDRASRHGRSLQAEVHALLEEAAASERTSRADFWARASALKDSLRNRTHSDSADLIREDRDER